MAYGFSTWMPRTPFARTLPVTVMLLSWPKRWMVPNEVEPRLVLPLIVELSTPRNAIPSDEPVTSWLLVTWTFELGVSTRPELLVSPLKVWLSLVALQRPKLVSMPLPLPAPGLLLFRIRLCCTSVGYVQS